MRSCLVFAFCYEAEEGNMINLRGCNKGSSSSSSSSSSSNRHYNLHSITTTTTTTITTTTTTTDNDNNNGIDIKNHPRLNNSKRSKR